ncbi:MULTISPECIES: hypothetical protein [Pseudomonas fluorescens group]|uniref:Uncharacterized protein n=3 Tax=Pseudomonas fluorescens group TaxID=136843 RepID=A0ABS0URF5_9PSED|nr:MULTISPECIES: hypothetical protein [Pseudomonas fluorescens group]MBI6568183.1 hypothetical protein [Pseudomonas synxantha]
MDDKSGGFMTLIETISLEVRESKSRVFQGFCMFVEENKFRLMVDNGRFERKVTRVDVIDSECVQIYLTDETCVFIYVDTIDYVYIDWVFGQVSNLRSDGIKQWNVASKRYELEYEDVFKTLSFYVD